MAYYCYTLLDTANGRTFMRGDMETEAVLGTPKFRAEFAARHKSRSTIEVTRGELYYFGVRAQVLTFIVWPCVDSDAAQIGQPVSVGRGHIVTIDISDFDGKRPAAYKALEQAQDAVIAAEAQLREAKKALAEL